jgi:hypothetical protein
MKLNSNCHYDDTDDDKVVTPDAAAWFATVMGNSSTSAGTPAHEAWMPTMPLVRTVTTPMVEVESVSAEVLSRPILTSGKRKKRSVSHDNIPPFPAAFTEFVVVVQLLYEQITEAERASIYAWFPPERFRYPELRAIYKICKGFYEAEKPVNFASVYAAAPIELHEELSRIAASALDCSGFSIVSVVLPVKETSEDTNTDPFENISADDFEPLGFDGDNSSIREDEKEREIEKKMKIQAPEAASSETIPSLTVDTAGYIDATALCGSYGVKYRWWARGKKAQAALTEISTTTGIAVEKLVWVQSGFGGDGRTLIHPQVAEVVLAWCLKRSPHHSGADIILSGANIEAGQDSLSGADLGETAVTLAKRSPHHSGADIGEEKKEKEKTKYVDAPYIPYVLPAITPPPNAPIPNYPENDPWQFDDDNPYLIEREDPHYGVGF